MTSNLPTGPYRREVARRGSHLRARIGLQGGATQKINAALALGARGNGDGRAPPNRRRRSAA